eukprot:TRINITY_DN6410_c0_g1_i2.p1 TRINITY_DN6410_c0_g1~~TRINITY_DN6410_c0_g1_i2.p1  ORF type:complete len:341 (-),score=58.74 TRINITY_DN6410_c0_g1_i2:4-1026(-)
MSARKPARPRTGNFGAHENTPGRGERMAQAEETVRIMEAGAYDVLGRTVNIRKDLDAALAGTRLYGPNEMPRRVAAPPTPEEPAASGAAAAPSAAHQADLPAALQPAAASAAAVKAQPLISVTNESTLMAAARLVHKHGDRTVAALNFASARNPGGGFLGGAQAQEESLARSSGLYGCLNQPRVSAGYVANRQGPTGLYTHHMIYSPLVPVFRSDNGQLLPVHYRLNFISAPAVNAGVCLPRNLATPAEVEATNRERIERILRCAIAHGHRVLVLGAFGCGVFKNNPDQIARLFAQTLQSEWAQGQFDEIVFAILARDPADPTLKAFVRVFSSFEDRRTR